MIEKLGLRGHIIDSLILSKILDNLTEMGVKCYSAYVKAGAKREDVSEAVFVIETDDEELMKKALEYAETQGALKI